MTPPQKGRIIDQAMQMFVSQGIMDGMIHAESPE